MHLVGINLDVNFSEQKNFHIEFGLLVFSTENTHIDDVNVYILYNLCLHRQQPEPHFALKRSN